MNETNVYIGLSNPKSPDNVNSVKRAAGNYGVDAIFYTGTRYPRALKLNPGGVNMSRDVSLNIPLNGVDDLLEVKVECMQIVCVEFVEGAIALPDYQHPDKAFYIFGPEDGNLTQAIIDQADAVVYVPTRGCMNLAATVNVLLYDRLAKSNQTAIGEELIRQSRDKNNNLKVIKKCDFK
ncbi:RNA methyltransferase [sulfur-oxidizing endosymbiont of Gigantopelta aegis]|uniref:RNA methyltransferase n=1 Tax=sulfur-oxidizing endosymbiont of Gigantopelta aegis TaxID=2794934 RepID=UPI0018DD0159|nr:RNA methyltransferase [sulfur-oxidizing endosymbiont of Gigantopelta aegis]